MTEGRLTNFADFAYKIGCHGNIPWGIVKWMASLSSLPSHAYTNPENVFTVSYVDSETVTRNCTTKK